MTVKINLPLTLNLQFFAEGDDLSIDNVNEEVEVEDNGLDGEAELFEALKSLGELEDEEEDESEDETIDDTNEEEDDQEENLEEEADLEEDTDTEKGKKREQSAEDNKKFAAQRRQQELDDKVQAELERLKSESPEFKLANQLAEMYGTTPEVILEQMKDAALQKEAELTKVPIETLRERQAEKQRLDAMEQELNQLRYERWNSRIEAESATLQTKFTMLTQEDMDAATSYILHTAKNVDMPLEQAVYALHGEKIIDSLTNAKVQDQLAKESGRKKKVPLSPNNGKPTEVTKGLTTEEKYVAKQLGLSAADYQKYKS